MSTDSLPHLHIRPEHGWLNDPNGMVWHRGRWHVFFQHNPQRPVHDGIAWGHVSSADLVAWDTHPVAFAPTSDGPDRAGCWSGVHLPWLERPAMAYSGIVDDTLTSTVCVREARDDDLERWGAPHVIAETPADVTQMRDPFCFEWGGRRLALMGARVGVRTPAVLLYSCDDPRAWQYEGVWLTGEVPVAQELTTADIWECPQLLEVDGRWVLLLSLQHENRLLSVEYLVGEVTDDGGVPRLTPQAHGTADTGPDCYAPQTAVDDDGHWLLGWIRQPDKPHATAASVSGCLTLPRRLALAGDQLVSRVDSRLTAYADRHRAERHAAEAGVDLPRHGRTRGRAATITLTGNDEPYEISCPAGDFEIWTDGEVVEVYRSGDAPYTLRQPGTQCWSLVSDGEVTISAVEPPSHARPAAPRAAVAADR